MYLPDLERQGSPRGQEAGRPRSLPGAAPSPTRLPPSDRPETSPGRCTGRRLPPGHLQQGQDQGNRLPPGHLQQGQDQGNRLPPGHLQQGQDQGNRLPPGHLQQGQDQSNRLPPGHLQQYRIKATVVLTEIQYKYIRSRPPLPPGHQQQGQDQGHRRPHRNTIEIRSRLPMPPCAPATGTGSRPPSLSQAPAIIQDRGRLRPHEIQ